LEEVAAIVGAGMSHTLACPSGQVKCSPPSLPPPLEVSELTSKPCWSPFQVNELTSKPCRSRLGSEGTHFAGNCVTATGLEALGTLDRSRYLGHGPVVSRTARGVILSVAAGAALYIVLAIGYGEGRQVLAHLRSFSLLLLLLGLLLASVNYLFRFIRWQYYLRLLNVPTWPLTTPDASG
jgi:hypothetical protein